MKTAILILVLVIAGCRGRTDDKPPPAPPPAPATPAPPVVTAPAADLAQGMAAYDAKDWARCATIFTAVAQTAAGRAKRDALYNAACCLALDGKVDPAFVALEPSTVKMTEPELQHVEQDTDLVALHADPRWPALIAAAKQRLASWEASLGDPALRRELLAMYKEDQDALKAGKADFKDKATMARVDAITVKHTARMKEIVAKVGWPGASLVGEDGANAAWLLVQHADKDLAFQKLCLAKMEPLVKTEEVSAIDHAYLWDRVAVGEKRPQRWGTQFNDQREPQPIEDPANVDARRAALGMPTMAQYKQSMLTMYGPAK